MQTDACDFARSEAHRLEDQLDAVYNELSASTRREAHLLKQLNQRVIEYASPSPTHRGTSGSGLSARVNGRVSGRESRQDGNGNGSSSSGGSSVSQWW